jgi:hypothetical protein
MLPGGRQTAVRVACEFRVNARRAPGQQPSPGLSRPEPADLAKVAADARARGTYDAVGVTVIVVP